MWQVGTSPGYKQINQREKKVRREHFKHSQGALRVEQCFCPQGKKWSCWYVYIRRKGSRQCHRQWFSLSRLHFDSWLYLHNHSLPINKAIVINDARFQTFFIFFQHLKGFLKWVAKKVSIFNRSSHKRPRFLAQLCRICHHFRTFFKCIDWLVLFLVKVHTLG